MGHEPRSHPNALVIEDLNRRIAEDNRREYHQAQPKSRYRAIRKPAMAALVHSAGLGSRQGP